MFKSIALATLALTSVAAQATPADVLVSSLYPTQEVSKGQLKIDLVRREISLDTTGHTPCSPDGKFCAKPAVTHVSLEMTGETADGCGVKTYVAREDRRPVDGPLQELRVVDYSSTTCVGRPVAPTIITYTTVFVSRMAGKDIRNEQTFRGSEMRPLALR